MAFNPGSYSKHADYQLMVERFRGVDSTDPAFQVANNRGTYANNYAFIDGIVQTRWARDHIATWSSDSAVFGVYPLAKADGSVVYIVVLKESVWSMSALSQKAAISKLADFPSAISHCSAVAGDHRLWLFTGKGYYMVFESNGSLSCAKVSENAYCHVPTTMTTIVATDAVTAYTDSEGNAQTMSTRLELAKPNMLSRWRKNKILTGVPRSGNSMPRFVLDGKLAVKEVGDYPLCEMKIEFLEPSTNPSALEKNDAKVNEPNNFDSFDVYLEKNGSRSNSIMKYEGFPLREENIVDGDEYDVCIEFSSNSSGVLSTIRYSINDFLAICPSSGTVKGKPYCVVSNGKISLGYCESKVSTSEDVETGADAKTSIAIKSISFEESPITANGKRFEGLELKKSDGTVVLEEGNYVLLTDGSISISDASSIVVSSAVGGISVKTASGTEIYGYIEEVGGSSVLTLFRDYEPTIAGQSNVTIKYPVYDSSLSAEIDGCTICTRFGHNNSLNRVWASGNSSLPNYVIHSEPTETEGDYSYFPIDGELRFGSEQNAVMGLDVIDTSKMIVLKSAFANERTIYFVSPTTETKYADDGVTSYTEEGYQITMSNSPVAINGLGQIANFYGATLFIGNDKKVNMLTESGAIGNTARQSVSVSHFIDYELSQQDLSEAKLFSFGKYLILNAGSRSYVSNHDSMASDSYQFEWWPCDRFEGASCFFVDEKGNPFYATQSGKFYALTLDKGYREDCERYFYEKTSGISSLQQIAVSNIGVVKSGSWDIEDSKFTPNADCEPKIWVGDLDIGLKILSDDDRDYLAFLEKPTCPIYDGMRIYSHTNELSFKIVRQCDDTMVFGSTAYPFIYEITSSSGVEGDSFYCDMNGEYDVVKDSQGKYWLYQGGKKSNVATFGQKGTNLYGTFVRKTAVIPEFVTKPLLCETLNYAKTITQAELWNDTRLPSELHAKMVGNKVWSLEADKSVQDSREQFSFDSASFEDCGFDKKVVPTHYSLKRFPKSQAFFTIMLKGNSKRVSVLSGVKLTYQKRGMSKGRG